MSFFQHTANRLKTETRADSKLHQHPDGLRSRLLETRGEEPHTKIRIGVDVLGRLMADIAVTPVNAGDITAASGLENCGGRRNGPATAGISNSLSPRSIVRRKRPVTCVTYGRGWGLPRPPKDGESIP